MLLRDPTWRYPPPFDDNEYRVMLLAGAIAALALATPFLLLLALAILR